MQRDYSPGQQDWQNAVTMTVSAAGLQTPTHHQTYSVAAIRNV